MKKTLNVNIGSVVFTIDEDAYRALRDWLDDIASRCDEGDADTVADVEMRVADLFAEQVPSGTVVTIAAVRRVIAIIGRPECFGERVRNTGMKGAAGTSEADIRRLRRSRNDRVLAGVCGGVAEYFGLDATLVRVLTFILIFFGGVSLWVYLILWIVIPPASESTPTDR